MRELQLHIIIVVVIIIIVIFMKMMADDIRSKQSS